ncbi:MAG: hypothetical protein M3Q73_00780 [bacterium]|nr:hypothetical protein [bacterium]
METPQNNPQVEREEPRTGVKILVLIALIALLIVGILLPIKLVPNAVTGVKDFFSSLFGGDNVDLEVNKDPLVTGEAFVLSWNGKNRTNGSYILNYPCIDGVRFETSVNQPFERITCDSQFYFTPTADNQIEITVVSDRNRIEDIPVTLSFLENSADEPKTLSDLTLTVTNPGAPEASSPIGTSTPVVSPKPTTAPTTKPTPSSEPAEKPVKAPAPAAAVPQKVYRVSNPNGQIDLAVQILDVGYLHPETHAFVKSAQVTTNMRAAVRFLVINNGDKNSGNWDFTAKLPSMTNPTFTAIKRENLGPGDGIIYTLGFEGINNVRENTITITVDPSNKVVESRENNNTYSAKIINLQGK